MHAQRLAHRVTFQRPGAQRDPLGQPLPGMQPVATVWAAVRPMGSTERLAAAQAQSGQTHVVTVRYSAALAAATGDWRIQFGPRQLDIIGLPRCPDESRQWLVFDATERIAS